MNNKVYLLKYKRTPIGNYLSSLSKLSALELGKLTVTELVKDFNTADIEMGYVGNVLSAGLGQNIGRQILYSCDINVPTITLNNVCGSGMQSIIEGSKSIMVGESDCVIVGGVESMSNSPYLQNNIRTGNKYGNINLIDSMLNDGLTDSFSKEHMGELTERISEQYEITKDDLDEYAKTSYIKARDAWNNNCFSEEVFNVTIKDRKNEVIISTDEEVNKVEDLNKLTKLRPAFKKDGTITAGNASKLSDGACFFILTSENYIKKHNLKPLGELINFDLTAGLPQDFSIIPSDSINNLCKKQNINVKDIDYFEINEAFASVPIMCHQKLNIPYDKINIFGGAIAMGHPLGCSGSRIVATLLSVLKNKNKEIGCASICNGGGGATSILIKNIL